MGGTRSWQKYGKKISAGRQQQQENKLRYAEKELDTTTSHSGAPLGRRNIK
jgi:hypothetical protein